MAHDDPAATRPAPLGVNARAIVAAGAAIALTVIAVVVTVHLMLRSHPGAQFTGPNVSPVTRIEPEYLKPAPQIDRKDYFEAERRALQRYGWVDRSTGIARIPIDAAIELITSGAVDPSVPPSGEWLPDGSVAGPAAATIAAARSHMQSGRPQDDPRRAGSKRSESEEYR